MALQIFMARASQIKVVNGKVKTTIRLPEGLYWDLQQARVARRIPSDEAAYTQAVEQWLSVGENGRGRASGMPAVDARGKKREFKAPLSVLSEDSDIRIVQDYPTQDPVRHGKACTFKVHIIRANMKPDKMVRIVQADAVWSSAEPQSLVTQLPPATVFGLEPAEDGWIYRFDLHTDDLAPGNYELQVRAGETPKRPAE